MSPQLFISRRGYERGEHVNSRARDAHQFLYFAQFPDFSPLPSASPLASVYPIFQVHPRGLFFPQAVSRISLFQGKKMITSSCIPLTDSSLLHLFCRNCEYPENLCHYLSEHRRHFRRKRNPRIYIETGKERLDALEKIDEDTTACGDVFSHLKGTASEE